MHFSKGLIAFVAATLFTSSVAAPVEPPIKTLNCSDPKTGTGSRCWDELNVANYLMLWKAKNVPNSCKEGEAWSICFDRLATTNHKQDCTQINSTECEPFDSEGHYLSPQWYYVAFNTWSVNQYFTRWYKAVDTLSKKHPATIYAAAQPQDRDMDAFLVASNKQQQLSIDVALHALIGKAAETPQILALVAAMKAFPSFVKYNSTNVRDS